MDSCLRLDLLFEAEVVVFQLDGDRSDQGALHLLPGSWLAHFLRRSRQLVVAVSPVAQMLKVLLRGLRSRATLEVLVELCSLSIVKEDVLIDCYIFGFEPEVVGLYGSLVLSAELHKSPIHISSLALILLLVSLSTRLRTRRALFLARRYVLVYRHIIHLEDLSLVIPLRTPSTTSPQVLHPDQVTIAELVRGGASFVQDALHVATGGLFGTLGELTVERESCRLLVPRLDERIVREVTLGDADGFFREFASGYDSSLVDP